MNVPLDMRRQLEAAFPTQPTVHHEEGGAPPRLTAEQRLRALERVAALFAAGGSDTLASRLFCALVHFSGEEFPIKSMLSAVPQGGLRLNGESILAATANLGFYIAGRNFRHQSWMRERPPVLVETKEGPVVVLPADGDEGGHVYDGMKVRPLIAGDKLLEGARFWMPEFESVHDPMSAASRTHTGHSWARALLSHFPYISRTILMLSVMLTMTGVLLPIAISVFFGQVIQLASYASLPYLVGGLIMIAIFETIFTIQRAHVASWIASRLDYIANTASFAHILKLSPFISERVPPTSQAARLRSFESIRDFVSGPSFSSILDIPVSLLSLALIAFLSPPAALIMLGAMLCFLAIFAIAWRQTSVHTSMAADEATELQRIAIETLDKLDLIRASGMQDTWNKRIKSVAEREQKAQMRLRFIASMAESVGSVVYTIAIIVLMAERTVQVWNHEISGATLLALIILGLRVLQPFYTLCLSVQRFEQIRRSQGQINSLMDLRTEEPDEREKSGFEPLKGRIELVNVGFKAADTRPVFVGLDLEVEPGQTIGIYGANGTGKTTIFKMILGMVDIALGTVRIDGVDLRQLPLNELRRRTSYVPQRPRIFPGTLRQNLAYANPLASPLQMEQVLASVGLSDDIRNLPNGLDYEVNGPDEERLSASFRYRFAFARALLINSKLILIDEIPNSLLNGEVGELMHRLLQEFRGKRTIVFVSHRMDFLREADRVVALRYGKVPIVSQPNLLMERAL